MITTNRRRQFGEVDDRIKIIHPQWWHIKFKTTSADTVISANDWHFGVSVKEVVAAPDGGTVKGGGTLSVDSAGEYEIFATISTSANTAMHHGYNMIEYIRLPKPYSSNSYLRPFYGYGGGGKQELMTHVYLINDTPPTGPSNSALQAVMVPKLTIYIPKGSLQNYLNNANTNWKTLYNAGRLIEVKYKIIED